MIASVESAYTDYGNLAAWLDLPGRDGPVLVRRPIDRTMSGPAPALFFEHNPCDAGREAGMSTDKGREAKRGVPEVGILALLERTTEVSVKAASILKLFNGSDPIDDDLLIAAFQDTHRLDIRNL